MKKLILFLTTLLLLFGMAACATKEAEPTAAVEEEMTWQMQYDLGMRYLSEGNYEEAIIAFTLAIEIEPNESVIYLGRAETYMNYVELTDAVSLAQADYEKIIELDATNPLGYLGLAEVYIAQGDFDSAIAILEKGLTMIEDEALQARLDDLNSGNISDFWGNERKRISIDTNGEILWYHICDYKDGRESLVTSYSGDGIQTGQMDILYDDMGNRIQTYIHYRENGNLAKVVYQYDDVGNAIWEERYDDTGKLNMYMSMEYDGNKLIKSVLYSADGMIVNSYTYEYNEDRMVRRNFISADGGVWGYEAYQYNDNGDAIRQETYRGDERQAYTLYEYDENDKMVDMICYDADGNVVSEYKYD